MHKYSFVVTQWGWTASNKITGKTLSGELDDLPKNISRNLIEIVKPEGGTVCVACTVKLPETSMFHQWFMDQSQY